MCSNENSERTIKSQQHQFRVSHTSDNKLSTGNGSNSTGCNNKNIFLSVVSPQCQKSPSELSSRTVASSNLSSVVVPQLQSSVPNIRPVAAAAAMSSMLGNSVVPPGLLPPLDHYRLQLYNYAMVERLRCSSYPGPLPICPPGYPSAAAAVNSPYGPRFALSMSLFHNRVFQPEEPKPQHSYIGLIAMAILSSPESKLVLSDIYQHILDNYPYFRTRGPGWRNSIRHNLSLNDCFIKAGRSANGKGHYWAIHPANLEDFKKGDFRRRKAQRKVRKHMGLAVDDEGTDSPSPPPLSVTPPPHTQNVVGPTFCPTSWVAAAAAASVRPNSGVMANIYSQSRKRQFDVASLLAPDDNENSNDQRFGSITATRQIQQQNQINLQQTTQNFDTEQFLKGPISKKTALSNSDIDEDIDVVASDDTEDTTAGGNLGQIIDHHDDEDIQNFEQSEIQQQQQHHSHHHHHHNQHNHHNHHHHHQHQHSNILQHPQEQGFNLIQHDQDHTPTLSPISQHDDDLQISGTGTSPSPNGSGNISGTNPIPWQGLIHQWPSNFVGTAMDPRILGRYYGQYMAAAAAQQAAVVRHSAAAVVGNFLNGTTATTTTTTTTTTSSNNSRNGTTTIPGGSGNSGDQNNGDSSDSQQQNINHKIQSEINPPGNEC